MPSGRLVLDYMLAPALILADNLGMDDRIIGSNEDLIPIYDPNPANALLEKHRGLNNPFRVTFGGAILEIDKDVFCPTFTKASPLLLQTVQFGPGQRVLDMFAGSGAFAISAALRGSLSVAVDVSPLAVRCARKNALLNGVGNRVGVRQGTFQDCVAPPELFDLILANPPLLPGDHSNVLSEAVFDPGYRATVDFIRMVRQHLKEDGRCYLVTSDVIERYGYDVDRLCIESGLTSTVAAKLDVEYESYRVHEIACP